MSMVSLIVWSALLWSAEPGPSPSGPSPSVPATASEAPEGGALAEAQAAHREGRYDDAASAYARAWAEDPAPDIQYGWAQVERLAGRCAVAVEHYDRFVAFDADGPPAEHAHLYYPEDWVRMVERSREMRAVCQEQLDREAASVPVEPEPVAEPEPVEESPAGLVPIEPEPVLPAEDEAPPRSWRRDPLGLSLLGVGAAVLGAGVGLVVVAEVHDARAERQPDHDQFLQRIDQAAIEQRVGLVGVGVGAALVLGGVVRLVVVSRRAGSDRRVGMRWNPRQPTVVGLQSRF